ncbi:hydroxymethylglutaryl-CoA synthase family protein [Cellulosilyticum ruminicola]|uniref:hydroxymethylglutaryl-CoA synthase family protein n=1 Tax=Cellulosilyticum ruminicola TaxID=425254 RepID=UPI0006D26E5B|nr:hydroxymethylglutaryl-CoA synthase family protein [Cellulosilyticum ruminicola]
MRQVGIELMNAFGGTAVLNVSELAKYRNLDNKRFDNLLMKEKSVAMPYEDTITFGVNAAKPIIDMLTEEEKNRIELLITCTESGIDFSKSVSTYIHEYLGLNRNCRLFEMKNACYAGTAGFQMAINFILGQASPGAKALVISSDISRFAIEKGGNVLSEDWAFAEPSVGAGAVAILVSDKPKVFRVDIGANGYYGHEMFDTCRPMPDSEAGNSDVSLMSYLNCCEQTFLEYKRRVSDDVSYKDTFDYLVYHTPFGGMVKGAHRKMMRKMVGAKPDAIEADFEERVMPGLNYCQRVANIMGATVFLNLASTIDHGEFKTPKRLGCFSYGSGCCSEFYSGVVTAEGKEILAKMNIEENLNKRYKLSMEEYEPLFQDENVVKFGTRNLKANTNYCPYEADRPLLVLKEIKEFHREYEWI